MSAFSAAAQDEDGDRIKTLQARVADLEAQLYAVGAGGVGKLEQPQSVTDCHQSQPKREPLTDAQINDHRLALPYDGEDLPDPWDFKQGVRAAERAHGIGGEA